MKTTVYISGGSHRAALGGIGAILYLLDSDGVFKWGNVDEMVGVSGGSQPIAALATSGAASPPNVSEAMKRLYAAIDDDRLTLSTPKRRVLVANIAWVATLPLMLWVLLAVFFIPAIIAFPIGLVTIAIVYRVVSWLLSKLQEDYIRTILRATSADPSNADRDLKELDRTDIHYSIVMAGVDTGRMYRAWIGPKLPDLAVKGTEAGRQFIDSISPVEASLASSSLPPTGRLRPPDTASNLDSTQYRELLIDGGVGGNFGLQITSGITKSIVTGQTSADPRNVLALDAGRRIERDSLILRKVSTVARLLRWVQLSGEATYLNDLEDLKDLTSQATAGSIDVATGTDSKNPAWVEVEPKQVAAVQRNADLDIADLDGDTIPLAVACGVIGALLTDAAAQAKQNPGATPITIKLVDAKAVLDEASGRLGPNVDLYTAWKDAP